MGLLTLLCENTGTSCPRLLEGQTGGPKEGEHVRMFPLSLVPTSKQTQEPEAPAFTLSISEVPCSARWMHPQGHKRCKRPGVSATPGTHQRGSKSGLGPGSLCMLPDPTPL